MRVFIAGGTGHAGSYIIPELIAAGHEVTGLARSDKAAVALSALGAKVRRGDLEDLNGLKDAAADSDGVIHVAHRQDLLPSGGIDAVAAAELPIVLAYGEALAGTGKPLVAAGSIGSAGYLGRPATEEDSALPSSEEHKGTLRVRNVVERAVVSLAERGVRSSIVRLPLIAHSTTDSAGFLPGADRARAGEGFRRLPRRRREPVVRRAHPRCRLRVSLGVGEGSGRQILACDCGRGYPVPRDRRGHWQSSGPAHRERSRGRHDAAGILRAFHESGHRVLPGDQPHHASDPRLGTHSARPVRRFGQRPLLRRPADNSTFDDWSDHGKTRRQGRGNHRRDKRYGAGRCQIVRRRRRSRLHHGPTEGRAGPSRRTDRAERDRRAVRFGRTRRSGPFVRHGQAGKGRDRRVVGKCRDGQAGQARRNHRAGLP